MNLSINKVSFPRRKYTRLYNASLVPARLATSVLLLQISTSESVQHNVQHGHDIWGGWLSVRFPQSAESNSCPSRSPRLSLNVLKRHSPSRDPVKLFRSKNATRNCESLSSSVGILFECHAQEPNGEKSEQRRCAETEDSASTTNSYLRSSKSVSIHQLRILERRKMRSKISKLSGPANAGVGDSFSCAAASLTKNCRFVNIPSCVGISPVCVLFNCVGQRK